MAKNNAINRSSGSLTIDPGSSGDSWVQYDINTTGKWRIGVDDDDSDSFKISSGSALGTNDRFVMDSNGVYTMASQPSFENIINAEANVSGDGTAHSIGSITATTSVFDRGGDMTEGDGAGTGAIFIAPVTGVYVFTYGLQFDIAGTGGDYIEMYVTASSTTYEFTNLPTQNRVTNYFGTSGYLAFEGGVIVKMTASDTCEFFFRSTGGAMTDDTVDGYLCGALVA